MTPPSNRGVWLEELSWLEAKAKFEAGAVVVIPIGAIAKEHGPHLPLNTDWLIARELGRRIADVLPVVVAPIVAFGYYPAFVTYPGSQHLTAPTFISLMGELIGNLIGQGVRDIALINTGISTEAPLRIACRDILERHGVSVACADMSRLGLASDKLLKQAAGGHADEAETSIMLAIDPALVDLSRAVTDYGDSPNRPANVFQRPGVMTDSRSGAFGDPTLATREKGEAVLAAITEDLVAGLSASFPEALGNRGK